MMREVLIKTDYSWILYMISFVYLTCNKPCRVYDITLATGDTVVICAEVINSGTLLRGLICRQCDRFLLQIYRNNLQCSIISADVPPLPAAAATAAACVVITGHRSDQSSDSSEGRPTSSIRYQQHQGRVICCSS